MSNSKKPVIRFVNYNDDWEQRKFSKIVNRVSKQSNDINLPKVEFEDIISGLGKLNKDVSSKFDDRKGTVFEPGFILYGKLRPYLKNWLFPDFKGIALGDFWIFEPNETSSIFDYYLIQGEKYQAVANLSSGTKMPRSDWRTVSETTFDIPASIDEQYKIGNLFKTLDGTIELHQRELTKLKQFKQSMLQKMFPREGQTNPEVRFKGFSGEWKKITLGELGSLVSGVGFPESEQKGKKGIPFYKVSDMNLSVNTIKMINSNNYVSETQIIKRGWSPIQKVPAIVFAKVGAALLGNRKRMVEKEFLIDNNIMAFRVEKNDKYFIYYMFLTIYLPKYAQVGALPSFNSSDIAKIEVTIPSLSEQQIVGTFFRSLDKKINLQEQKLTKIKQFKQAMLQKMFV